MALSICTTIPFSYIAILAFRKLLQYEDRKELSEDQLLNYYEKYGQIIDSDEDIKIDLQMQKIHVIFCDYDIERFKEEYQDYFDYHEDTKTFSIKENVTLDKLDTLLDRIELKTKLDYSFRNISEYGELKSELDINYIFDDCEEQLEYEKMLFQSYLEYLENPNDKILEEIRKRLYFRNEWYGKILKLGNEKVEAYQMEYSELNGEDPYYVPNPDGSFDVPIDFELWERNPYFDKELENSLYDDSYVPLEEAISTVYQYAIFTDIDLAPCKMDYDLTSIYGDLEITQMNDKELMYHYSLSSSNDKIRSHIYFTDTDQDLLFYLLYCKKIKDYIKEYGSSRKLEKTKMRLIYAMDNFGLFLLDEDNFDYHLQKRWNLLEEGYIDCEDLCHFQNESYYFIQDVFENRRNTELSIIKKLLFVATYYEITEDIEIEKLLREYMEYPNYTKYSKIILGPMKQNKMSIGRKLNLK